MEDKSKDRATTQTQPAYDPPQAMRLSQVNAGHGACQPGSGDIEYCYFAGNTAAFECLEQGNGADGTCLYPGNDATTGCIEMGNGYIG